MRLGDKCLVGEGAQLAEYRTGILHETLVGEPQIGKTRGRQNVAARIPRQPLSRRLGGTGLGHEHLLTDRARHSPPARPRVCDRAAIADKKDNAHITSRYTPEQTGKGGVLARLDDHFCPGDASDRRIQRGKIIHIFTNLLAHTRAQPRRPVEGQCLWQGSDPIDLGKMLGVEPLPAPKGLVSPGAPEWTRAEWLPATAIDIVDKAPTPQESSLTNADHPLRLAQYAPDQRAATARVTVHVQYLDR